MTPYTLAVTARSAEATSLSSEVRLERTLQTVAIPLFQFGVFSESDLSYFPGPNFNFGGRVHTNGNLFLSHGGGATLTLSDKVTAVKEIVRQRLQNGESIDTSPAHDGTVKVAKGPGSYRSLLRTEGSVQDGIGSADNEPTWHTASLSTYNSWLRNGRTGAKPLNLSLITVGGTNTNLVQRPAVNEDTSNPALLDQRLFTKASLRILLSDTASDITDLPTVTSTAPVSLEPADWPPTGYTASTPIATSPGLEFVKTGSSTSSSTIKLSTALPAYFQVPSAMTLVGNTTSTTVRCDRRTATQLELCDNVPKFSSGDTLTAQVPSGSGTMLVTRTLTNSNSTAGNNKTLQFASTADFAPTTFWIDDVLITCTGYDISTSPDQFTGCSGLSSTPGSNKTITTSARSDAGTGTIGGYIKIERQATDGSWNDVTLELLNYGIAAPSQSGGSSCASTNAIVLLERRRDTANSVCTPVSANSNDYWPNTLFDAREGLMRDSAPSNNDPRIGGVMHYVSVDVENLAQWFMGTGAYTTSSGTDSMLDNGGYTVYFSDRRNNRNSSNEETGEYGYEDFVNPTISDGSPDGTLETGEDVNANGTLETYGGTPSFAGVHGDVPPGAAAPLDASAAPDDSVGAGVAQVNRAIFFRRALKLVNGSDIAGFGVTGLTVVSENPVYVKGDWNALGSFSGTHAATSVIADAVTLLSNNWTDAVSYTDPYSPGNRNRGSQSWYRLAIISGKGMAFPRPSGTPTDFGTDGGAHNFLRYLEDGDQAVNYRGSIATFFYNRQGVGTYKCCATVYAAPTRNYGFDTDFLTPSKLPPNTPMFRDLNAVGFAQEMRPGK
jgi:hypothetical protein